MAQVKVYRYAAKQPTTNLAEVQARLKRGHCLRNDLIRIELDKRAAIDAVLGASNAVIPQLDSDIAALEAQIDLAAATTKKQNQQNHKRTKADPAQSTALKGLRQSRSALKKALREAKKSLRATLAGEAAAADPELTAMMAAYAKMAEGGTPDSRGPNHRERRNLKAAIESRTKQVLTGPAAEVYGIKMAAIEKSKAAKAASNLHVYHQTAIGDDVSRACKGVPRFRRYDGCGRIYVQIQGGIPVESCGGNHGFFRLVGEGRQQMAYMRIASEGRQPVWATVPVLIHRPLPAGARIVGVRLVQYRIATHSYWELQLECKQEEWLTNRPVNRKVVAIDMGWRKIETGPEPGIRVASWISDQPGGQGELIIPSKDIARWTKIDTLQSVRDTVFEAARNLLRDWLKTHSVPDWLRAATASIHAWRSARRLAGLLGKWRTQRFEGDEAIYTYLDGPNHAVRRLVKGTWRTTRSGWRNWDKHLYEWQEQQRAKALRWRDDIYRKFAAQLTNGVLGDYGIVRLEDANWSQTLRKAPVEDDSNDAIRRNQRIAAPGRLREILKQRFAKWEEVEAKNTTARCHRCGVVIAQFGAGEIGMCPTCGPLNREQTACYNILMSDTVTKSGVNQTREVRGHENGRDLSHPVGQGVTLGLPLMAMDASMWNAEPLETSITNAYAERSRKACRRNACSEA